MTSAPYTKNPFFRTMAADLCVEEEGVVIPETARKDGGSVAGEEVEEVAGIVAEEEVAEVAGIVAEEEVEVVAGNEEVEEVEEVEGDVVEEEVEAGIVVEESPGQKARENSLKQEAREISLGQEAREARENSLKQEAREISLGQNARENSLKEARKEEEEEEAREQARKEEEEEAREQAREEEEEACRIESRRAKTIARMEAVESYARRERKYKDERRVNKQHALQRDADDAIRLKGALTTAEMKERLDTRSIPSPTKTFQLIRTLLDTIPSDYDDLASELEKIKQRPVLLNESALADRLPNVPLVFLEKRLEDFGKLYTNLKAPGQVNVFDQEFAKRVVLYRALQTMSRRVGSMYAQLLHLLFLLSPKTFVVALYAVTQKCVGQTSLSKVTIFETLPSIGTDVTDIFRDHLADFYRKGCVFLNLPRSFTDGLRSDCVSFHELKFLTSFFTTEC